MGVSTPHEVETEVSNGPGPLEPRLSESGYQADLASEKIQTTRVSAVLAALLYLLFGILDIWAIPSSLALVWSIRAATIALLGVVVLSTYRQFFVGNYTAILTSMYLGVGGGIEAMIFLAAPNELARTIYYSGLILVVYALYTWTYLSTPVSLAIGLSFVTTYLWIAIDAQGMGNAREWPVLLANAFFFISASVIGFVGGNMRNRFARENFRLRQALEEKLEQTIAARRESELAYLRKLEDSEALKTAIIDTAPVGLVTTDAGGQIVEFNPSAERCFACARQSALGRPLSAYVQLPHLPSARTAPSPLDPAALPTSSSEAIGIRADDSQFPIEIAVARTRLGDIDIYTAFIVDLTQKHQAEEEIRRQRETLYQREKLAAMGSLLAGVAHELNNPLAVVVGRSLLLEEQVGTGPERTAIGKIREAAERCARIVKTFLSMARQQRSERHPVDLNHAIESALEMVGYSLRTAGIEVTAQLAPGLPMVYGDEDQLHQVFMNLIVNAQQAMADQPGLRRLTLTTLADLERRCLRAEVIDSGPGIAPENRARVFEPYFTTKPQGQGTGVGLAVCLGIVESHGGSLRFDCPSSGGARFVMELPLDSQLAASENVTLESKNVSAASSTEAGIAKQQRLLIVDDETELAEMLSDILAPLGPIIDTASNGREALVRLEQARYDVVLSDLRMPDLDGPGLHREIEQRWPELRGRVIFVTGDGLSPWISQYLEDSRCPVVEKPFNAQEIRRRVSELLAVARDSPATPAEPGRE